MQKPLIKRWYVIAAIIIFCAATIFIMVKSFLDGYEEGRMMKQEMKK